MITFGTLSVEDGLTLDGVFGAFTGTPATYTIVPDTMVPDPMAPIPEPTAGVLFLVGAVVVHTRMRRRHQSRG